MGGGGGACRGQNFVGQFVWVMFVIRSIDFFSGVTLWSEGPGSFICGMYRASTGGGCKNMEFFMFFQNSGSNMPPHFRMAIVCSSGLNIIPTCSPHEYIYLKWDLFSFQTNFQKKVLALFLPRVSSLSREYLFESDRSGFNNVCP